MNTTAQPKIGTCCDIMHRYVVEHNLEYDPVRRIVYFFIRSNEPPELQPEYYGSPCIFCPYCGTKIPKMLSLEYLDELEIAVGKDYCDITDDEVPEEFKTDEWWIKRGL